jgi:hypothetical protein
LLRQSGVRLEGVGASAGDLDHAVVAGRDKAAVGEEGECAHAVAMSVQCAQALAVIRVPELDAPVTRRRQQLLPAQRQQRPHRLRVPCVSTRFSSTVLPPLKAAYTSSSRPHTLVA